MNRSLVLAAATLDRLGLPRVALAARRYGLPWGGGLTVLLYHRVVEPTDILDLDASLIDATPTEFDRQMDYVRQHFHPVGVDEVLAAHRGQRKLRPGSVLVTFDDGYRDNYEHALPVLKRHGISGLFFVTTGYVTDRRLFWWERVALSIRRSQLAAARIEYPEPETLDLSSEAAKTRATRRMNRVVKDRFGLDLERFLAELSAACGVPWSDGEERRIADHTLMTWENVKQLRAAGMGIGSHTRWHRVLQTLPPAELAAELTESRALLEEKLGEPVATIAYPVGKRISSLAPVRQAVKDAGYEIGFTTSPGVNRVAPGDDPFDWRRLPIDRGVPTELSHLYLAFPSLAR